MATAIIAAFLFLLSHAGRSALPDQIEDSPEQAPANLRFPRKMLVSDSLAFPAASRGECACCRIQSNDAAVFAWYKAPLHEKPKGVALVVHGLNLNPGKMGAIISFLNRTGIDVLNLSLRGHENNFQKLGRLSDTDARLESFRKVDLSTSRHELFGGYEIARERARLKNVPVVFVGYSLGGLLGCDLLAAHPEVSFDKMVLFAPALDLRIASNLLKFLFPFHDLVINSLAPESYRANRGTPIAAYKSLFDAVENFETSMNTRLNTPTLVFIDEEDEFISFSGLKSHDR